MLSLTIHGVNFNSHLCAYFAAAESRISLHPAPTLEEGQNIARWRYGWLTSVRYFGNKVKGKILTGMNKFDL